MKNNNLKINYIFNMIYQVLTIILPIITTPYISRILNPDGIGAYNYSYSIAYVFVLISNLGTSAYAQREIAFCQENKKNRSKVFWEILIIRIAMSICITPIYFVYSSMLEEYAMLLYIQNILIVSSALDISWFFQGLEDFKRTALCSIVSRVISVVLIFVFVKSKEDIGIYTLIVSFANVLNSILLWPCLKNSIKFVNFTELKPLRHMKAVLLLFLPTAAIYVYTSVDKIVLGYLSTDAQVGYYSQAEKIVKLVMTIVTSLGTVMLPTIASLISQSKWEDVKNNIRNSIHFVLYLGLPMMFGLIAVASVFVPLFLGEDYYPSVQIMQFLAPLVVIIGLSSVTGQAVLIPLDKQGTYTISILIGALLNVICNFIFIPQYEAVGAVIGTLIAESSVGLIQQVTVMKALTITPYDVIWDSRKSIIASIIMLFLVMISKKLFNSGIISMFFLVLIGCVSYFLSLVVMQDDFTLKEIKKITGRFKNN